MHTSNERWFMHANMPKLNIGCGKNTLPTLHGWVNLDLADLPGEGKATSAIRIGYRHELGETI